MALRRRVLALFPGGQNDTVADPIRYAKMGITSQTRQRSLDPNMSNTLRTTDSTAALVAACRICTIRLEQLCYRRAWWFRPFREALASGIRLFALVYRVPADAYAARSPLCYRCIRFHKNTIKQRSRLFNWADGYLNPMFNRVRDSLLTPEELDRARAFAQRAGDPVFSSDDGRPSSGTLPVWPETCMMTKAAVAREAGTGPLGFRQKPRSDRDVGRKRL